MRGHNDDIRLAVTFSETAITDIQVLERLIPLIIRANGLGGNALTEILVSGRIAAASATQDAKQD